MRTNEQVQQGWRLQDQYTKINCIFILAMNKPKWHQGNNFIYNSIKENRVLTNKFLKGSENCSENCRTLLIETKKDLNKWKDIPIHALEDLMLSVWQYSPNWSIGSIQTLSKYHLSFFNKLTSWLQNPSGNARDPGKPKQLKIRQNKVGRSMLPDFKTY